MHKSAFYLAIGCGMRNSEIRALTTDDIDFKNGIINIDKQAGQIRNEKGELKDAAHQLKLLIQKEKYMLLNSCWIV